MDSILVSIKKTLGIEQDYTHFDPELILAINSVFGILFQLGVGSSREAFVIHDATDTWDDFMQDAQIETVKNYIAIKVKLLFDPPSSSSVLASYQELAKEFEWRCHIDAETP